MSYEIDGKLVQEDNVCKNKSLIDDYNPALGGVLFFKLVNEAGCPWG